MEYQSFLLALFLANVVGFLLNLAAFLHGYMLVNAVAAMASVAACVALWGLL